MRVQRHQERIALRAQWNAERQILKKKVSPESPVSVSTAASSLQRTESGESIARALPEDWGSWCFATEHRVFVGATAALLDLIVDDECEDLDPKMEMFVGEERPFIYRDAARYVKKVTQRLNFNLQAVVASVQYITRLAEAGKITFSTSTWRALWLTSITIADRVIEDDFMQEKYVAQILNETAVRSKDEFRDMQWHFIRLMDFRTSFDADEFVDIAERYHDADASSVSTIVPLQSVFIERDVVDVDFSLADLYKECPQPARSEQKPEDSESDSDTSEPDSDEN
jgi:hypothetical protein